MIDGKRLKEDKNASPHRRSSDERLQSSPDHRDTYATSSIEQHGGMRRPSSIGSPRIVNTADWRPLTLSNDTSPETTPPDFNTSPRHNKPAFASINAPQSNTPAFINSQLTSTHSGSPMHSHPMAISTSMAYGYHPMIATQNSSSSSSNSPPLGHSRRPTLASETSLPSLRHSDSLGSSSAGSPLNTSAPSNSVLSRGLPSRELPPPFTARQNGFTPSLPPMKTPGSPARYSPLSSGLATLLRAGEHLASNGPDVRLDYHDSRC